MATSLHLASGGSIVDTNSNALLNFAETASAVNYIKITNKETGNGPLIEATGNDENVGLNLKGKGTGSLRFNNIFTVSSTGALDVPGTLDVTGATTLTGALAANGGISVATNKFTIASTGVTAISTNTDSSSLTITNNTGTALDVIGQLRILDSASNIPTFSHSPSGGTDITGATSINGGTSITGNFNVSSNTATIINVDSNTETIAVTGTVDITGNTYITGSLNISGNTATVITFDEFDDSTTILGSLTVGADDTGHDVKFFGATSGAYMLWDESEDKLIVRGPTGTGAAPAGILRLETAETSIVDADILGKIEFIAPVEADGTDAIALAASIYAEADATFDANTNTTDLVFAVASSGAAEEKMRLTSAGSLNVTGSTTISGGLTLYQSDGNTAAFSVAGNTGSTSITGNTIITGDTTITGYFTLGGDLSNISQNAEKMKIDAATLTTDSDSNISSIAGLRIAAPTITLANNSTVTTGASLWVAGPTTGASNNYAAYINGSTSIINNTGTALNVTGLTNITGDTSITGSVDITGALTTTSTTKFGGYTYTWPSQNTGSIGEFLKISGVDNNAYTITLDWDTAGGGGGVTTLDDLTDVVTSDSVNNFTNSIFISTNNTGDTLTTITNATNNIIIGAGGGNNSSYVLETGDNNIILGNNAFTSASSASDNIVLGVTAGSSITTGGNNTLVGKSSGTQVFIVTQETGTLDANGNSSTIFTLESTQSDVDDYYNNLTITFTSGANSGETRTISDYDGTTQTVTVSSAFTATPSSNDTYQINYGNLDANGNSTTVFTLESDKSSTDDFYNGCSITFTSGQNDGESRTISDYVGSSQTVTVSSAFSNTPSTEDTYYIKSAALSTGDYNTLIGSNTYCTAAGDNQTSLGYQAGCTAANQVTLGNSSITALRCADTTIASLSDARDKTNVSDSTYGIDFINSLRPVQYTWDRRNLQPGDSTSVLNGKTRVGFLAQELQDAMPNGENDVLDLVYEVNPNRLEAKYGNLIPILTKAIQDLSAANEALMARVTALENA